MCCGSRSAHAYIRVARFLYRTPASTALSPSSGTGSSSSGLLSSPVPARQYENPFKTPERASQGRPARLAAFQAGNLAKHSESQLEGFCRFQGELQSSPAPSMGGSQPVPSLNPREAPVPTTNGVPLVPLDRLPARFRSVFSYPHFNAVQSRCFDSAYNSPDNLVVSAPTGSGKTAVLELAICALLRDHPKGTCKVVYQAPTKALCFERKRGTDSQHLQPALANPARRLGKKVRRPRTDLYRIDGRYHAGTASNCAIRRSNRDNPRKVGQHDSEMAGSQRVSGSGAAFSGNTVFVALGSR